MSKRGWKWLFASGAATTLSIAFTVSASAQPEKAPGGAQAPGPNQPAPAAGGGVGASASARSAQGMAASAPGAATPGTAPPVVRRVAAAPLLPPTPQQIAALDALRFQADAYERGARDYRDAVTSIIQLHYEDKKRKTLSGMDREITTEKEELRKARERAIARLEQFIQTYSGARAQPEATPDAMYRLAALYEERARVPDATEDLAVGLEPAIKLYKRVIKEFPKYKELAGIYYFLGHAYNDSGRIPEAQQVWRSLVCKNHFEYPTKPDPTNPDADTVLPLPQDHDEAYWIAWRKTYPTPQSIRNRKGADTSFVDPYPADCASIAKTPRAPGEEPPYLAEIWWRIGDWEFDQLDAGSGVIRSREEPDLAALPGVFTYNRAATAYSHSLKFKKPPVYGVVLYKYAWTLFKQQRYEAATREFVRLLLYTDEQQRLTGDPGADFRGEAYTYIAGSLTNVDFKGPDPNEPFIPRPDIIETEANPAVAEQKLHVAIDRAKDSSLIPQDKPWCIEIYKGLAQEYRSLNHFSNAIEVYELMLKKWPMDPTAPDVQASIAETYDQMLITRRPGTVEHDQVAAKALEARTALANYIGNTPWVDANKDNPAAIQNAERLVRGGLRQAAVQHTNNGKQALVDASQSGDTNYQVDRLTHALSEYRLASLGWSGFLKQDENAPDAYESRYWLADARHNVVRIGVVLHKLRRDKFGEPTRKEIDDARAAALDVRDSNEDDKFLDNAAFFVVDVADVDRDLEYQRFEDTKGAQGLEQRTEVKLDSNGPDKKVVKDPIPAAIMRSVQARDEYVQRVPANLDVNKNALAYQYYAAETFFLYGHFDEARARFEPMYRDHCAKDEYGYRAWDKLITMSNLMRDIERSRQLAEAEKARSCAANPEQVAKRDLIVNPTLQEAAYVKARERFKAAREAPPGPQKDKLWREAAGLYEAALSAAPARDEAPEAAMNAAYAYKQVGESNRAIDLYNKFISEYGSEARLSALEKGDPKAKTAPDPKKYQERVQYLGEAFDALSSTYFGFFNYQRAAETYDRVSSNPRFEEGKRRDAARNAMVLYANMGQRDKMLAQSRLIAKLHPSSEDKVNQEFLVANYDYKQWNPAGPDSGTNRTSRVAADTNLQTFYKENRANVGAGKYVIEAAYQVAKVKKAAGDPAYRVWLRNTVDAWEAYRARGPVKDGKSEALSPPYADYAAEADYSLIDEEIRDKFDYETGHHRYAGSVEDIIGKVDDKGRVVKEGRYQLDAKEAEKLDARLQHIVETYPSLEWVPAAMARQGTLYDSLRTGLYNAVPPNVKYFTPQQEALLKKLEDSGRQDLQERADQLRDAAKEGWRDKKERELNASDEVMVRRYATAVALARHYNVRNPTVQHAVGRLAYFTDVIGDAKLRDYVTKTGDPTDPERDPARRRRLAYTDGMFLRGRSGLVSAPPPVGRAAPLPLASTP